jgi:outer membrane protein
MKARRLLGLGVLLASALFPLARVGAQQPVAPLILIVDMQRILEDAKAAKGVQSVISQQYNAYSKEVAQQEDELQKARTDLEAQRTVLTPDAFSLRARELQQHYDDLDQVVQGRRQALQQSLNEAMAQVNNAALEAVRSISEERHANLVVLKQAIVFEAEGLDVTSEAITRLDEKLSSVPVKLPKSGGETAKSGAAPAPAPDKKN